MNTDRRPLDLPNRTTPTGRRDFISGLAAGVAAAAFPLPAWGRPARNEDFSLALVGDIIYLRPSLAYISQDAAPIFETLRAADATFGNFESSGFARDNMTGGHRDTGEGPVILASPAAMAELRWMGFDIFSVANNHGYDWFEEGVRRTRRTLQANGFTVAGSGESLSEARQRAVHDAGKAKVALISATMSLTEDGRARDGDETGGKRAGLNSLRLHPVPGEISPGGQVSDAELVVDPDDRAALLQEVAKAGQTADVVVFSLHAHQKSDAQGIEPPRFIVELAHAVVDAGADVVAIHGPHQLRGIETYKGKAIFHSLANFAVMLPDPALNPKPLHLPPGSIFTQRAFFESVIATTRFRKGIIHEIELQPFELRETGELETHCLPRPVYGTKAGRILSRIESMSRALGTKVGRRGDLGVISLG